MQIFYPILDFVGAPLVATLFAALIVLETFRPLRRRMQERLRRIVINLGLAALMFVVLRLLLIPVVVLAAAWAHGRGFGLVKLIPVPHPLQGVIAFCLLDYTMYVWHWLNHQIPFLWRFHNVHHTDLDLDVSTAMRFHFGEMLLSVAVRSAQVMLVGAGPILALVYEIALEVSTEFHHSNLRLPHRFEKFLNLFIVTPRMHGIHHSIVQRETNSNFSNMFTIWDRLHRTVRLNIRQDDIVIGVPSYRDPRELTLVALLLMPFAKQRREWRLPDGTVPERPTQQVEKQPSGKEHLAA